MLHVKPSSFKSTFLYNILGYFEELKRVLHYSSGNSTSMLHALADVVENVQIFLIYLPDTNFWVVLRNKNKCTSKEFTFSTGQLCASVARFGCDVVKHEGGVEFRLQI